MIILYLLTAHCLFIGLGGAFYMEWPKRVRHLSFAYFGVSVTAQLFAAQYLIVSLAIFALAWLALDANPWLMAMSGVAAALFALNLWRSYQGTRVLDNILPGVPYGSTRKFIFGALFPLLMPRSASTRIRDICYGEAGRRNLLDIYVPDAPSDNPRPVLIHVHGGAWVIGRKYQQAQPLIRHLTSKGWILVDINYRLGPKHRLPVMVTDVLRAIGWVRTNIAEYGGDPKFIALTGGSAGGHLTALAALASGNKALKPGFEDVDCSVDAAVPVYGVYDFLDRTDAMSVSQHEVERFLTKLVMPGPVSSHKDLWDSVSPLGNIHENAPPMFMVHGRHDVLAPFKGVEIFAKALKNKSKNEVVLAALPSGQHAYDLINAPPTIAHVHAVERFLNKIHAEKSA